ncbi:MAG: serine/threonine protein kinase [Myxococcales bacterium]|nr:serine/threonine protein kinase [Myxococcales bacterium]
MSGVGESSALSRLVAHVFGTPSEEGRAFFQKRVAFFAALMLALVSVLTVLSVLGRLALPEIRTRHDPLVGILTASVGVGMAAIWLFARGKPRAGIVVSLLDATAMLDTGVLIAGVSWFGRDQPFTGVGGLLGIMLLVFARALIVPSTGTRTAVLSMAASAPGLAVQGVIAFQYPEHLMVPPVVHLFIGFSWASATVAIASLGSGIIYGLREQVTRARQLGQYTLTEKLGEGGMGVVYRAKHAMLRRPTAVKLLPPDKAGKDVVERFEREVQLTSELTHPNTIAIYDYGRSPEGIFYYAMEHLDGIDLHRLVERYGPLPPARAIAILVQACGALAEAHGRGLVHRDIKPANLILSHRGGVPDVVKVLDFGLVKDLSQHTEQGLTGLHQVAGTPGFLPPEAMTAPDSLGPSADLYALGCLGYYLVTGKAPFSGATVAEVCGHHLHSPPPRASELLGKPVGAALEALLARCLAKSPEGRPASARALRAELEALPERSGWSETDGERWWERHQATLETAAPSARSASAVGYLSTVLVDVASVTPDKPRSQRPRAAAGS